MTGRRFCALILGAVLLLAAGVALAQPGAATMPQASAAPDTVSAELGGPRGWPVPVAIRVWPAEPRFGEVAALLLDFPGEVRGLAADSLTTAADWLEIAATGGSRPWWRRWFGGGAAAETLTAGAPAAAAGTWRAVVAGACVCDGTRAGPVAGRAGDRRLSGAGTAGGDRRERHGS